LISLVNILIIAIFNPYAAAQQAARLLKAGK